MPVPTGPIHAYDNHQGPNRTFVAGEALEAKRLVRLSTSAARTVVYADAGERPIGRTASAAASGEDVTVEMLHQYAGLEVTAAVAITVGQRVSARDDGNVGPETGTFTPAIGVAEFATGTITGTNFPAINIIPYVP